jgi:hypothetical protein
MFENTLIVGAVVVVSVIVGGALGYAKGLCDAEEDQSRVVNLREFQQSQRPRGSDGPFVSRRQDTTVIVRMVPDSTFGGQGGTL